MKRLIRILLLFSIMFTMALTYVPSYVYADGKPDAQQEESNDKDGDGRIDGDGSPVDGQKNENTYTFDTHDAVVDIMNNDRYVGAISSISWLTDRVDRIFMQIISVVAFFIISTSLLKNACAGAYCANPKFWNKVDEAHQKSDAWNLAKIASKEGLSNLKNLSPAGVKDAILGIVPNIKALTEFEDAEIEPKHYFMRAIPQMLGCIIIGIFIYNGYYRDTASSVGAVGSEICNRVFASVDPTTFVDKLTQTSGTPDNIYKNDPSIQGTYIKDISNSIYRAVITQSAMIKTKEGKTALMRNSENLAYQWTLLSEVKDKTWNCGSSEYEYALNSIDINLVPNGSHTKSGFISELTQDANGDYSFVYYLESGVANIQESNSNFGADSPAGAWTNILSTANDLVDSPYGALYMQGIFKRKETSHNTAKTQITATAASVRNQARPTAKIDITTADFNNYTVVGGMSGGKVPDSATVTLDLAAYAEKIAEQWQNSAGGLKISTDTAKGAKAQNSSTNATLGNTKLRFNSGVNTMTVTYQLNGTDENGKPTALMCTVTIDISGLRK